jgi:hypothetical protein
MAVGDLNSLRGNAISVVLLALVKCLDLRDVRWRDWGAKASWDRRDGRVKQSWLPNNEDQRISVVAHQPCGALDCFD